MTGHLDLHAAAMEADRLLGELVTASQKYRAAKARFVRRTDAYRRAGVDRRLVDIHARGDYLRQSAMADCAWFGDEMNALGAALTAILAALQRERAVT